MKILKYTLKKFIRMIILIVAVTISSFFLFTASPIDPVQSYVESGVAVSSEQREEIADYWGLNDTKTERFKSWFTKAIKGDMGQSLIYRRPVLSVIGEKFKASLVLMAMAWIISGVLGFTLGMVMGIFNGKPVDKIIKSVCIFLSSTPSFWLGMVFLIVFSVKLGWFPIGLSVPIGVSSEEVTIFQRMHHAILPALTLGFASFSNIALHTRVKIKEIMESDYVLFAKARGESFLNIINRHIIRNAIIPAITLQFASISEIFGGSVLAEQVFSYTGLGQATVEAGIRGDIPLLLGIAIISSIFVFFGNFIADILYNTLDPRIRIGGIENE